MLQDADTDGLIATCRLLCSSGSRCLVAVEKRTSEVYDQFVNQARAAFGEVRAVLCVIKRTMHASSDCGHRSIGLSARRLQLFHTKATSGVPIRYS